MYEVQLLKALSQCKGGVQVNMSRSGATVTTRYTPLVKGQGKSLLEAAGNCAQLLLGHSLRRYCPDVVAALIALDNRILL